MRIATVCGGAQGVWGEFKRATELIESVLEPGDEWIRMAVNDAGVEHPDPLHHWVTMNNSLMRRWRPMRTQAGRQPTTWSIRIDEAVDRLARRHVKVAKRSLQDPWIRGSSGLLGVDVAINQVGADAVILCGIPMARRLNQFTGMTSCWESSWPSWQELRDELEGTVRSWSGRTLAMLGEPTAEWLAERRRTTRNPKT